MLDRWNSGILPRNARAGHELARAYSILAITKTGKVSYSDSTSRTRVALMFLKFVCYSTRWAHMSAGVHQMRRAAGPLQSRHSAIGTIMLSLSKHLWRSCGMSFDGLRTNGKPPPHDNEKALSLTSST